jgi:hypothetical protein
MDITMIDKRYHALSYLDTYIHSCQRNKTCHNNLVRQAHNFQMRKNFTKVNKSMNLVVRKTLKS